MAATRFPALLSRALLVLLPLLAAGAQEPAADPAAELRAQYEELRREGAEARAELAGWAFEAALYREAGLLAREVLRVVPEHEIGALVQELEAIDADDYVAAWREALKTRGREWRKRRAEVVAPLAERLVELAKQADDAGEGDLAEEVYCEAFRTDSDNSKAKAALKRRDYEMIFNYGALPETDKKEARRALRRMNGGFQNARDLAEELEFWTDAWGLETRHYRFVTNAPHPTVFRFAQACEDLYEAWDQLFAESRLKLRRMKDPLVVYFFDSPVTYQAILRARGVDAPPVDGTLGFYWSTTEVGYFYDDPGFYAGDLTLLFETFYHEGTHQLVDQRLKAAWKGGGAKHPTAWVGEGIALYLELLEIDESADGDERSYRLGEFIDDDLGQGIDAFLAGELMPLPEFLHCDEDSWEAYDWSYPHASLVACFLMHAADGAYRRAFFELIESYEETGGSKEPLPELLKTDAEQLTADFDAFVRALDQRLQRRKYAGDGDEQPEGPHGDGGR